MAIKHNYLGIPDTKPLASDLSSHEIVINEADGSLWSLDSSGSVISLGKSNGEDGESVDLITDQTIGGVKTFTENILNSEAPIENNHVANKLYVDNSITGTALIGEPT